jgi:hypothetical protein
MNRVLWRAGTWSWALLLVTAGEALAQTPPATAPPPSTDSFRPRIVREGTVSFGLQGGYGSFLGGSGFADDFSSGPNLAVRLRYRTGRESAIGLSFEGQRYDAKDAPLEPEDPEWVQVVTTTAEYYQFFSVRKRAPRYVVLGAGLAQSRRRLLNEETDFPGDGGVIILGAGTEFWWQRTISFELSARYYGILRGDDGSTLYSNAAQVALGVHFYTSR